MMTHPSEEEMVDGYYSGAAVGFEKHLAVCQECRDLYRSICEALAAANESVVPERGADYGARVWARVSRQLPVKARRPWWMVPAVAAGLGLAFAAGMWTEHWHSETPFVPVAFVRAPAPVVNVVAAPVVAAKVLKPRAVKMPVFSEAEEDTRLLALNSKLESDAKEAVPEVLALVRGKSSDRTQEHALFVLAQSDSPEARAAFLKIARDAAKPELQTKAVRMMGMLGDEGARQELAGLYRTASNPALKREILNGLMFSGSKTTLLKVAKTEPDPDLRSSAMAKLSITALPDPAPNAEKRQILNSVFLAGDSQVLLDVLRKQPDAGMRVATIRSLAVLGDRSKVLMTVYRTDSDEEVRRAVLDALVVQQNGEALAELAREETDGERKVEILRRVAMIRVK
jgi:HEAT repeat protein